MELDRISRAKKLIGEQFKRRRVEAGISQNALAKQAKEASVTGANRSYIIDIEKGQANVTIETLAGLLSLCHVDFEEFLTGMKNNAFSPEHQEFHRMLSIILNSGSKELVFGIRVNLEAISEKALRIRSTKDHGDQPDGRVVDSSERSPPSKARKRRSA